MFYFYCTLLLYATSVNALFLPYGIIQYINPSGLKRMERFGRGLRFDQADIKERQFATSLLGFASEAYRYPDPEYEVQPQYLCSSFEMKYTTETPQHISFTVYRSPQTETLVIAFRGTVKQYWDNIKTDVSFALRHCELGDGECGKVHLGFQEAYKSVKDQLLHIIDESDAPRIYLTGHSLGGALALLAAYDLASQGYPVKGVVTFGAPRVGTRIFEDAFGHLNIFSMRLQQASPYKRDVVTRIPPKFVGYSNAVKPHFYVECFSNRCLGITMHRTASYEESMGKMINDDEACLRV